MNKSMCHTINTQTINKSIYPHYNYRKMTVDCGLSAFSNSVFSFVTLEREGNGGGGGGEREREGEEDGERERGEDVEEN